MKVTTNSPLQAHTCYRSCLCAQTHSFFDGLHVLPAKFFEGGKQLNETNGHFTRS